jgi:hypothetical protein
VSDTTISRVVHGLRSAMTVRVPLCAQRSVCGLGCGRMRDAAQLTQLRSRLTRHALVRRRCKPSRKLRW